MSDEVRLRWAEVEPLGVINGELNNVLANVNTLREAWELSLAQASPAEFTEAWRRSLRHHAIETGIIERRYPDLGITEALVVEGFTTEVQYLLPHRNRPLIFTSTMVRHSHSDRVPWQFFRWDMLSGKLANILHPANRRTYTRCTPLLA